MRRLIHRYQEGFHLEPGLNINRRTFWVYVVLRQGRRLLFGVRLRQPARLGLSFVWEVGSP